MAYIGRGLDKISNIEHLDTITFDGSSSYSLTKSSVAFTPNSAQSLLVSIDGVVQSNNFTVSGSTIDFGVAVPSTSTCDFIKHFGTGVAFTPADGTVGLNQLSATGTKDATTFLRGDNTFAEAGGGKLLQVVQTTKTTSFTTNSTSWTDITGYSATITPSSTSSKILVLGNYSIAADTASAGGLCYFKVLRGSTDLLESTDSGTYEHAYHEIEANTTYGHVNFGRFNLLVLDSPSTTSATTYKGQMRMNATSNTVVFGRSGRSDTNTSDARGATELILMEIGA